MMDGVTNYDCKFFPPAKILPIWSHLQRNVVELVSQSGSKRHAYKAKGKLGPNATKMKKQNEGTSRNINLKVLCSVYDL
jgi:hypothetical protein